MWDLFFSVIAFVVLLFFFVRFPPLPSSLLLTVYHFVDLLKIFHTQCNIWTFSLFHHYLFLCVCFFCLVSCFCSTSMFLMVFYYFRNVAARKKNWSRGKERHRGKKNNHTYSIRKLTYIAYFCCSLFHQAANFLFWIIPPAHSHTQEYTKKRNAI